MNLLENLGIQIQSITANQAILTIEVSDNLKQPYGIVHGGINAVLAETAASLGANEWLKAQGQTQIAIGVNLTTEHLRAVVKGIIKTVATPLKTGRTMQTWEVKEFNENKLTSVSVVTLINKNIPNKKGTLD